MKNIIRAILEYKLRPTYVKDEQSARRHIEHWLNQFDKKYQEAIITTMDQIMGCGLFIDKERYINMCSTKAKDPVLTNNDPRAYWAKTFILDCQKDGKSQKAMVEILKEALLKENIAYCQDERKAENLFYLDDFAFTFGRISNDITNLDYSKKISICPIVLHSYNEWYFADHHKEINLLHCLRLENRACCKNQSEVFWPHIKCMQNNIFMEKFQAMGLCDSYLRDTPATGNNQVFPNEDARILCEEAFFIKGAEIWSRLSDEKKKNYRPLGVVPYRRGWGFGGSVFSYRNCPNATPLVIWWGSYSPLSTFNWHPLMIRDGYSR